MKRVICLLLSAAILASCSETAAEPSGETTAPSPEAAGNEAAEIPETEKPDFRTISRTSNTTAIPSAR